MPLNDAQIDNSRVVVRIFVKALYPNILLVKISCKCLQRLAVKELTYFLGGQLPKISESKDFGFGISHGLQEDSTT